MAKPRRVSKRVALYRETVDAMLLGMLDGAQAVGEAIVARATPSVPDRPPFGRGLIASGTAVTYLDGKVVAGPAPGKIRAGRGAVPKASGTVVGWGFPGRFLNNGTIYIPPSNWVTPAFVAELPEAEEHMAKGARKRIARLP
jgi:hypothetical protein